MPDWLIGTSLGLLTMGGWLAWRHHELVKEREQLRAMMAFYRERFEESKDV